MARSENSTKLRAVKPRDGVDRDEKKNQSSLTEQTRAREKKRARRRVHEIVFPSTEEINFVACQHMFAGGVPEFVIKDCMTAEIPQKRKRGEDCRGNDKEQYEDAGCSRSV